jgi:hypothetical protein
MELVVPTLLAARFPSQFIHSHNQPAVRDNIPTAAAAAWDFCRRGILRPGPQTHETGAPDTRFGYTVTPAGEKWLTENADRPFIPTEPGAVAELLAKHRARFGDGFHERAQEAIRCLERDVFLACCAMCGAAAESILLAAAIEKLGRKTAVDTYREVLGRSKIEKLVLEGLNQGMRKRISDKLDLLKYWRDDASHGAISDLGEPEARIAVEQLCRLAELADDNWDALTTKHARPETA